MGSDAMKKSSRQHYFSGKFATMPMPIHRSILLFALTFALIFLFLEKEASGDRAQTGLGTSMSNLRHAHDVSDRTIPEVEMEAARKELPKQCHYLLENLNRCQASKETVVFGCHRKWCSSYYGHCEEVNGIGDRTQRMLSMVTDAISKCVRVEFDYPQSRNGIDLRFPSSLEYRDPWEALAEVLHFRSYDVSGQGPVDVESWGRSLTEGSQGEKSYTFTHLTPKDYVWHRYDPCLYHILFMNTGTFQTDLNYYTDLFKLREGNTIGIHFRTGDLTAFGVENKDIRAQGQSLEASYNKMVSCAEALAQKLSLDRGVNRKYNFFLATDNQHVKDMATNDERFDIHMTKEYPSPYLNSDGDRAAYLDLYLLSQTRGLAVNVLPDTYDGPAERVSTFARLSWNIGFMNDKQLYECEIG